MLNILLTLQSSETCGWKLLINVSRCQSQQKISANFLSESDSTFWLSCVKHLFWYGRTFCCYDSTYQLELHPRVMFSQSVKCWTSAEQMLDLGRTNVGHKADKMLDHFQTKSWRKLSAGFAKWVWQLKIISAYSPTPTLSSVKFNFLPRLPL